MLFRSEDDEELEGLEAREGLEGHSLISAKTVAAKQPRPEDVMGNQHPPGRQTVGGKGRKGEEALEHAVAAREEVERRRVENRGEQRKTVPGGAAAKAAAGSAATAKIAEVVRVKEEDETVVVQEEEAGEAAAPVSCPCVAALQLADPDAPAGSTRAASSRRGARQHHSLHGRYERRLPLVPHHSHRPQEHLPEAAPQDAARVHRPSRLRPESLQHGDRQAGT